MGQNIVEKFTPEDEAIILDTIQAETTAWPDPEPVKAILLPVEQLPLEILPDPFRDWIADSSYRMQVKPDIVAIGAMVAAGALIGAGCNIKPKQKDSWTVTPNLWGCAISEPGTLKTPALAEAVSPLVELEKDAKKIYDDELTFYEAEKEVFKAQRDGIKNQMQVAAKGKGSKDLETLKQDYMGLDEPEKPIWKRFKTNDSTIEMLSVLLEQNPRGLLLFRDEMIGLLSSWDQQGREADRAFFLEAWNGYGSITTDRIGRGTTHCNNLCISLLGSIQPAKLLAYLYQATSALENDGLIQRMQLMVYPDSEKWQLVDEYPDKQAKNRAFSVFKKIAEMNFIEHGASSGIAPYFHFNNQGQEVFYQWLNELQNMLQADENPVLLEHLAKYRSLMPSLALIDHIANIAGGHRQGGPIPLESAERAAAWCDYLESHARRIYGMIGNTGQRAAIELSKKLKNKKLQDGFSVRDIYQRGWHLLTSREIVKEAVEELEEANWLKGYQMPIEGRQPKSCYLINPKIFLNM